MKAVKLVAVNGEGSRPEAKHKCGAEVIELARATSLRHNEKLIAEYQQTRDSSVLEEILERNQGLLHSVLKQFSYFPDPYEDLLQVANMGLIKAVQRYDGSRATGFSSYAVAVVDGEIRHYLRDNVLLRRPRWLKRAEQRIEEASLELTRKLKRRPTLKELSDKANISEDGILEIMKARAASDLFTADDPVSCESVNQQPDTRTVHSLRHESFSMPIEDRIALQQAFDTLSDFQRKIVYLLFYKDLTQSQVAEEMGLTQRKVSRESAKALDRLKAVLNTKIF
ncbi:MAG: sigma-70 family RNA polymerase sigma factor [Gaiellales bacterium]|nr:MAG: sigma-70 family RNA polymerase sigma factor [Gaiellales bacterium]